MRKWIFGLIAVSIAAGGLTFSLGSSGGTVRWDPVEGDFERLALRGSPEEFDAEKPEWGAVFAEITPDPETGEFPVSLELPAAYMVLPGACISCGLCLEVCPVDAISMEDDGKAVIDPESCIACGICVRACPVDVIFAPGAGTHFVLFGVDGEGIEVVLREMTP